MDNLLTKEQIQKIRKEYNNPYETGYLCDGCDITFLGGEDFYQCSICLLLYCCEKCNKKIIFKEISRYNYKEICINCFQR